MAPVYVTTASGRWDYTITSWNSSSIFENESSAVDSLTSSPLEGASCDSIAGFPYPSLYPWQHIILSSLFVTIIMLAIVVGNGLVVIAIAVDRNLKGLQNWFIGSLALSDLFVGLFVMPLSLANELMGYWHFGEIVCQLWLSTDVLLCTASILNLCLISLDRYWSITRAIAYIKQRTKRRVVIMISMVWILSMVICLPPLVGWKRPQPTKFGYPLCVLSEEPGYVVYSSLGSFYIPLSLMVLVYFKIYLAARDRARRNLNRGKMRHNDAEPKRSKKKKRSQKLRNGAAAARGKMVTVRWASDKGYREGGGNGSPESFGPKNEDLVNGVGSSFESREDQESSAELNDRPMIVSSADGPYEMRRIADAESQGLREEGSHGILQDSSESSTPRNSNRIGSEENRKPLLDESSQPESDCPLETTVDIRPSFHHPFTPPPLPPPPPPPSAPSPTQAPHGIPYVVESVVTVDATKKKRARCFSPPPVRGHPTGPKLQQRLSSIRSTSSQQRRNPTDDSERHLEESERTKRRIARAHERRATIVLGIVMASFIGCWLPFFAIYPVTSLTGLHVSDSVFAVTFWLGYCNSALNPIIYTIFNRDFRIAFLRIICGRRYDRRFG